MIDFKYLTIFIAFFAINVLAMKLMALRIAGPMNGLNVIGFLFKTPVLTLRTLNHSVMVTDKVFGKLILRSMVVSLVFFLMYHGYHLLFSKFQFPQIAKSYLLVFFIYVMTLYMYTLAQLLCLPSGQIPVDMHNHPILAKNIREFWGVRWNVWVRDWLNSLTGAVVKTRNPQRKIFFSFLFSGLFHEVMFQLPYGFYSGNWVIGPMMAYFLIQWPVVLLDMKIKDMASDRMRRFIMWVALVLPAPLFINESLLYFMGL